MSRLLSLIFTAAILITVTQAKEHIRLDRGEKRFKPLQHYTLKDFNFN
jgi:hypothetical protein